jgi:hypothetical protein
LFVLEPQHGSGNTMAAAAYSAVAAHGCEGWMAAALHNASLFYLSRRSIMLSEASPAPDDGIASLRSQ